MKKANNFLTAKVQPQGIASLLLVFFSNFILALHIKVLLIKKRVSQLTSLRETTNCLINAPVKTV